jgi:hypothetical protein
VLKGDLIKAFLKFLDKEKKALIAIFVVFKGQDKSDLKEDKLSSNIKQKPKKKPRKIGGLAKKDKGKREVVENIEKKKKEEEKDS